MRPSPPLEAQPNAVALQILFRPSVNAIERFLDVLDRVRHAETQITFAEFAKRGPGERSDPGILEKRVGESFRWPTGLSDVRKNIERAVRQLTGETLDFVKPGNHHIAAFLKLVAHVINPLLRPAQCFDTRDLAEARSARAGVCHQTRDVW